MTQFIYQSPKKDKRRSTPVDETDTMRRRILEKAGWIIIKRIDDDGSTSDVIFVDEKSAEKLRQLEEYNRRSRPTPVEATSEDDVEPEVEEPSEFEGLDEQIALKLIDAGYDTLAALNEATDEELEAIDGIGPATVLKIRQALAFAFESDEEAEDEDAENVDEEAEEEGEA